VCAARRYEEVLERFAEDLDNSIEDDHYGSDRTVFEDYIPELARFLAERDLALAKTPIEGPAGVEASFDFRAAFNATAGRMMAVVLRNQQAGAEYG
jgi:hypothetical protein